MLPLLPFAVLLAQSAPVDPNLWTQLGVAGGIVIFAVWVIVILLRIITKKDDEIARKDQELKEARQEIRETNKAQLELAERALPSLNETARVVAEASDELRRSRRR